MKISDNFVSIDGSQTARNFNGYQFLNKTKFDIVKIQDIYAKEKVKKESGSQAKNAMR